MYSIVQLDPNAYQKHSIHSENRCWVETNCYADVLIELIHALGFEPVAALPFSVAIDFETDQWTFFKFPHNDLLDLFGMDIQELNPWRSLAHHIEEQVNDGRPVLVELDSFYLPDTVGTAYQAQHLKSTVAINQIDIAKCHMGYFHGQGYYHLDGQDFIDVFQLDGIVHERLLPPYIELIKLRRDPERVSTEMVLDKSLAALRRQVSLMPTVNPFHTFRSRFEIDLQWLLNDSLDTFHTYSFATLRQYGACFELVETYLKWLSERGENDLDEAIDAYRQISKNAKTFQFKLARAVARKKQLDLTPIDAMGDLWQRGAEILTSRYR